MKRFMFLFLLVLLFANNSVLAQEPFFFYYGGERQELKVSTSHVAIHFQEGMADREIPFIKRERGEINSVRQPLTAPDFLLINLNPGLLQGNVLSLLQDLKRRPEIKFVSPVFTYGNGLIILTDEILVEFKESTQSDLIEKLNQENRMTHKGLIPFSDTEIITADDGDPDRALAVANLYSESGLVEFAEPNFVKVLKPLRTVPNDPYFPSQWNLDYNVSWRADINAPEGWDINRGSTSVIIAILDMGVDLNQWDLKDNLVGGYDATSGQLGGWANWWDWHGTAVAGIAAARTNNSTGVSGVCWYCKIMPVRVMYDPCYGDNDGYCDVVTGSSWLAAGTDWAWQHGASVLNMSYGGSTASAAEDAAINRARTQGRGGKGSVLVAGSGNGNVLGVLHPARNSQVIAVGATNPCGGRKTKTACSGLDGEYWWGSNYGPELDVVAPGVYIYTTDNLGSGGCSSAAGGYYWAGNDYCKNFDGTSAATPHVAGLAGLIISKNLTRTATQVEDIIKSTAFDISPAGFDIETGYGLIDVLKALQQ
ncbi:MAG: S8 family serine peptidase [Nitrospirae bacterium]|nr:S8 family serine peptidase [Nitrospirota bacterium]